MTVELLQTLSLVAYISAGVLFLIGVVLFFLFDVPKLYGEISGRTAKKAIENIRHRNEGSGNLVHRTSSTNLSQQQLTDKIPTSNFSNSVTKELGRTLRTDSPSAKTFVSQSNETTLLSNHTNETTVLVGSFNQMGETSVLVQEKTVATGESFSVDVEMSFTGSSEIIE